VESYFDHLASAAPEPPRALVIVSLRRVAVADSAHDAAALSQVRIFERRWQDLATSWPPFVPEQARSVTWRWIGGSLRGI